MLAKLSEHTYLESYTMDHRAISNDWSASKQTHFVQRANDKMYEAKPNFNMIVNPANSPWSKLNMPVLQGGCRRHRVFVFEG